MLRNSVSGDDKAWNKSEKVLLGFITHHKELDFIP